MTVPIHRVLRSDKIRNGRASLWVPVTGNKYGPAISSREVKDWIAKKFVDVLETTHVGNGKWRYLVALTEEGKAAALAGYRMFEPEVVESVKATGFVVVDGEKEESVPDVITGLGVIKARAHGTELLRLPDRALLAVR